MKVKFTTTLEEELLKEAKKQAIDEGRDLNKLISELLQKYLDEKKLNK